jgi:3',5'-cyclic AMP phosphodiesterase CpdA
MASPSHSAEENAPTIVVQVSDLHLREGADGAGPAERLTRALAQVSALQPYPDAVLVSGDVVDAPSRAAYEQARDLLGSLGVPIHVIPGNHDDRDMLRAHLAPGTAGTGGGGGYGAEPLGDGAPVNFAVDCGELRLVGCDTTVAGHDGGALGAAQLSWLDETLRSEQQSPTLLAMHHPPVLTGVRVMDAIALAAADRAPLEAILDAHPQVRAITCGHVHTTMSTSFAGRPLLICPSTNSTVRLDLRPRDDLPFVESDQPVGFAVHTFVDGRLVSHVQGVARGAGGG